MPNLRRNRPRIRMGPPPIIAQVLITPARVHRTNLDITRRTTLQALNELRMGTTIVRGAISVVISSVDVVETLLIFYGRLFTSL